jgi:tetratricopeptide (TPR) repeat protein
MTRAMRNLWVTAVLCAALAPVPAWAGSYGTELPFVLGTGVRSSSMGVAGVSLGGDASAQYYNPSALSFLEWKQFAFFRSVLFDSKSVYHAVSYAHPLLDYGTIGVSVLRLDVGGIEERDGSNQLLSNDLHSAQTRVLLGYGKAVTPSISAGLNIKVDNQTFGSYSGSGVGMDFGVTASQGPIAGTVVKGLRQAVVIQNIIEPGVKLEQDEVSDPMRFTFGASALTVLHGASLITSVDLVNPRFSPFHVQFGQEVAFIGHYAMRFSIDDEAPTYGFGARYGNIALDYAYRDADLGNNNRLSLTVRFGSSLSEERAVAREAMEHEINVKITDRMARFEQNQIRAALSKGDSLFAAGRYGDAADQFDAALLWDPENTHAKEASTQCTFRDLAGQGSAALNANDFARALFYYKQALELVPEDTAIIDAVARCNAAIAASKNSAEIVASMLKQAIDLYASQAYAKAVVAFDEVLKLEPKNSLAREYREKCRTNIENRAQRKILDARARAAKGDFEGSAALYEEALALKPGDSMTLRELRAVRANAEAKAKADATRNMNPAPMDTAVPPLSPSAAADIERKYGDGLRYFQEGRFEDAVRPLTDVWNLAPRYRDVSELLSKAYLFLGMRRYAEENYAEAIEIWRKALTIDPDNAKAQRYLNRTTEEFKKLQGAQSG